ncbi:MAG: HupU protein, partial [Sphaerotilus natans]
MNLLWLQSGGCGGCSMSLLCADTADFAGQLEGAGIRLLWHPSLSLASGADVVALLDNLLAGRIALDALCVEGA